jgi:hypothetical protein
MNDRGTHWHHGLLKIVVSHTATATFKHLADDLSNILMQYKFNTHDLGYRLTSQIVMRGTESTTHNDCIRFNQCGSNDVHDALMIIANLDLQQRTNAMGC